MWPAPPRPVSATPPPAATPAQASAAAKVAPEPNYFMDTLKDAAMYAGGEPNTWLSRR